MAGDLAGVQNGGESHENIQMAESLARLELKEQDVVTEVWFTELTTRWRDTL